MHLFYSLKWDKTYAALDKTNAYLIVRKSWSKTNDYVNNLSASPREIKSQLTKTCLKLAIKTLKKGGNLFKVNNDYPRTKTWPRSSVFVINF